MAYPAYFRSDVLSNNSQIRGIAVNKICGAPGCSKLSALAAGKASRKINGIELCRACYQRIWELEQNTGTPKEQLFQDGVAPPQRSLPRIATTCARKGCGVNLPEGAGPKVRRTIGLFYVCTPCYQLAWEHAKRDKVSVKDAFHQLKPKNWRPDPPKTVRCCLPWCDGDVVPDDSTAVSKDVHACGVCRTYLKLLGQRPRYRGIDWTELAAEAIRGNVSAPGTPEICAMSWCNSVERSGRRGPNGEALCNTDSMYLYRYAKRHNLTFEDAFRTAPPPRLLHPRGRKNP